MIKLIAVPTIILVSVAMPALAQGGPPRGAQQPSVLGQTGTMYDGNNANLQLPPEVNAWYDTRWAGYQPNPQPSWYFGVGDLWYAGRWIGYEPNPGSNSAGPGGTTGGGEH
jgi:hypothetical protein